MGEYILFLQRRMFAIFYYKKIKVKLTETSIFKSIL